MDLNKEKKDKQNNVNVNEAKNNVIELVKEAVNNVVNNAVNIANDVAKGTRFNQAENTNEVDSLGIRLEIETSYKEFSRLNNDFKELCTDWQLKPSLDASEVEQVLNDHSDPEYDKGVIDRLVELDKQAQPVCASLAEQLERFSSYGSRFTHALEMVLKGDTDWIAKPMIESYHTVWFELHENFFSTLGIDRASEST